MIQTVQRGIRNQRPVELARAQTYLLWLLIAFAATVTLTRAFLELTGYPQVGNEVFHIAHAIWGGLLLFLAALLPIVFANRWVYEAAAVLSGIGAGLFIDEVGKFITQTNDYFFPLAAPIIYAFFLITVLVYLQVRRPGPKDPRAEMYRSLEELKELLDRDFDPLEEQQLRERLDYLAGQTERPDIQLLATQLQAFLDSQVVETVPRQPPLDEMIAARVRAWERRWLGPQRFRRILFVAYAVLAVFGVLNLLVTFLMLISPEVLEQFSLDAFEIERHVRSILSLHWYLVRSALESVIGALFVVVLVLFVWRRYQGSVQLAKVALVLSLTTVNMLTFYFDQFSAITVALLQIVMLGLGEYYLHQYPDEGPDTTPAEG